MSTMKAVTAARAALAIAILFQDSAASPRAQAQGESAAIGPKLRVSSVSSDGKVKAVEFGPLMRTRAKGESAAIEPKQRGSVVSSEGSVRAVKPLMRNRRSGGAQPPSHTSSKSDVNTVKQLMRKPKVSQSPPRVQSIIDKGEHDVSRHSSYSRLARLHQRYSRRRRSRRRRYSSTPSPTYYVYGATPSRRRRSAYYAFDVAGLFNSCAYANSVSTSNITGCCGVECTSAASGCGAGIPGVTWDYVTKECVHKWVCARTYNNCYKMACDCDIASSSLLQPAQPHAEANLASLIQRRSSNDLPRARGGNEDTSRNFEESLTGKELC